jgi:rod shape-determining protein MreD
MSRGPNPEGQSAPVRPASRGFREPALHPGRLLGRGALAVVGLTLLVIVQATLMARVRVLGASPNLLLVSSIAWGLLHSVTDGVVWAFAGGVVLDLITGMALGTTSIAAMTATLLTRFGRNRVFANNLWWPLLVVAIATPVYGWIVLLTEQLRGIPVDWVASTIHVVGPETLLNVAAMALVYPAMRAMTARPR